MRPAKRFPQPATCGLCHETILETYVPKMYHFEGKDYDLLRCRNCGNVQVWPMLDDRTVARLYQSVDYYKTDYDSGVTSGSYAQNLKSILERQSFALEILKKYHPKPGTLLEIGCAEGFFLETVRNLGWRVQGVEIGRSAAAAARKRGLLVKNQSLQNCRFAARSFDAVYMGDVFEHLPNPTEYLQEIRRILKRDGNLIVKCPHFLNSRVFRLIYGAAKSFKPFHKGKSRLLGLMKIPWHRPGPGRPYHLYEYNSRTLKSLMNSQGLEVVEIRNEVIRITFADQFARGLPVVLLSGLFNACRWACIIAGLPIGSTIAVVRMRQ